MAVSHPKSLILAKWLEVTNDLRRDSVPQGVQRILC